MGFKLKLIEAAFVKTKTWKIDEIIDLIVSEIPEDEPEDLEDGTYNCPNCSFLKKIESGPICIMCGAEDKDFEKILKSYDQQSSSQHEENKEPENESTAEQKILSEKKLNFKVIQDYFNESNVTHFFAASHLGGKSRTPLVIGCAMQGKNWVDLHLKWAKYCESYIS